jgi:hypothetical protein
MSSIGRLPAWTRGGWVVNVIALLGRRAVLGQGVLVDEATVAVLGHGSNEQGQVDCFFCGFESRFVAAPGSPSILGPSAWPGTSDWRPRSTPVVACTRSTVSVPEEPHFAEVKLRFL